MSKYNYEKETFSKIVESSRSISEVAKKLGMKSKGGNWGTVKRKIEEYQLDTSHFTGQSWSKGKSVPRKQIPIEDYLTNRIPIGSWKLKNKLIEQGIKENKCEICGISEWNGKEISCTLHHADGNNQNNELSNLQILCPNCHSQTENFAGKHNRKCESSHLSYKRMSDQEIFQARSKANSRPIKKTRRVVRPETYEDFKREFLELNNNYCAMGRKYGVSDSAIRKWERSYKKYGV